MCAIKIIIDGVEYVPSYEEKEAVTVDRWYDRHIRLWTLILRDDDGNQVGDAIYCYGKKRALEMETEIKKQINRGARL